MAFLSNSSVPFKSELCLSSTGSNPAGWRRWWREESLIDGTDWTTLLAGADQVLRELRAQHVARSS
jgi:hypothetical protein